MDQKYSGSSFFGNINSFTAAKSEYNFKISQNKESEKLLKI